MKIVAPRELSEWCLEHAMLAARRSLRLEGSVDFSIALEIPTASDDQLLLTRDLLKAGETEIQQALLWITAWRVWNDPPPLLGTMMIDAIRLSGTGERVSLEATSATLLGPNEDDSLQMMIFHCLVFRWDAWLAPVSGRCTFQVSHDGLIWIESADWETHNGILARLRRWKPRVKEKIHLPQ